MLLLSGGEGMLSACICGIASIRVPLPFFSGTSGLSADTWTSGCLYDHNLLLYRRADLSAGVSLEKKEEDLSTDSLKHMSFLSS